MKVEVRRCILVMVLIGGVIAPSDAGPGPSPAARAAANAKINQLSNKEIYRLLEVQNDLWKFEEVAENHPDDIRPFQDSPTTMINKEAAAAANGARSHLYEGTFKYVDVSKLESALKDLESTASTPMPYQGDIVADQSLRNKLIPLSKTAWSALYDAKVSGGKQLKETFLSIGRTFPPERVAGKKWDDVFPEDHFHLRK